jgi:hypothetical protein
MRRLSPCNNYDLGHTRVYWIRRITIIYMIYQIQISNRVQRMIRYNEQMGSACSFNLIKTHVDLPNEPEAHETVTVTGTQLFSIQHGYRDSCTRRRSLPISGRGSSIWELEDGLAGKGAINMKLQSSLLIFLFTRSMYRQQLSKTRKSCALILLFLESMLDECWSWCYEIWIPKAAYWRGGKGKTGIKYY